MHPAPPLVRRAQPRIALYLPRQPPVPCRPCPSLASLLFPIFSTGGEIRPLRCVQIGAERCLHHPHLYRRSPSFAGYAGKGSSPKPHGINEYRPFPLIQLFQTQSVSVEREPPITPCPPLTPRGSTRIRTVLPVQPADAKPSTACDTPSNTRPLSSRPNPGEETPT